MDSPFIPPGDLNWSQLGFLGLVYAYILCQGSELISDGSELLLLVPALAGVVGSVVLPVLGAVPDGMMVLFSGIGDNAKEQIMVGVGTLAGSTVMLLTIAWYASVLGGRVNIIRAKKLKVTDAETGAERFFRRSSYVAPAGVAQSVTHTSTSGGQVHQVQSIAHSSHLSPPGATGPEGGSRRGSVSSLATSVGHDAAQVGEVKMECTYHPPPGCADTSEWEKLMPAGNRSLKGTGVKVNNMIKENAKYMLLTSVAAIIVQIGALCDEFIGGDDSSASSTKVKAAGTKGNSSRSAHDGEEGYGTGTFTELSLYIGMAWCLLTFLLYLRAQFAATKSENSVVEAKQVDAIHAALDANQLSLRGKFAIDLARFHFV